MKFEKNIYFKLYLQIDGPETKVTKTLLDDFNSNSGHNGYTSKVLDGIHKAIHDQYKDELKGFKLPPKLKIKTFTTIAGHANVMAVVFKTSVDEFTADHEAALVNVTQAIAEEFIAQFNLKFEHKIKGENVKGQIHTVNYVVK